MIKTNIQVTHEVRMNHLIDFNLRVMSVVDLILADQYGLFSLIGPSNFKDYLGVIKKNKLTLLFGSSSRLEELIDDEFDSSYGEAFHKDKLISSKIKHGPNDFTYDNGTLNFNKFYSTCTVNWIENELFDRTFIANNTQYNTLVNRCKDALKNEEPELFESIKVLKKIKKSKRVKDFVETMFDYKGFRSKKSGWNGQQLIEKHGLRCCPYCGRQYITSFKKDNNSKSTAQLDHLFPKERYPYLALSLYNLIPSCATCNHYKSAFNAKNMKTFNPFLIKNKDVTFRLVDKENNDAEFSCLDRALSSNSKHKIKIIYSGSEKILANTIEALNLEPIYQTHILEIKRLLAKMKRVSSNHYYRNIKNLDLVVNQPDLYYDLFSEIMQYDEHEIPLNKLYKDIYNQFRHLISY